MKISHNRFSIFILLFSIFLSSNFLYSTYPYVTFKPTVNQTRDIHFTNKSHCDFSHGGSWSKSSFDRLSHSNKFSNYTVHDFKNYFIAQGYTEAEILNERCLYMLDEFVKYAQTHSGYKNKIRKMYAELKNLNIVQKAYYIANGTYCKGLQRRIRDLYKSLDAIKEESLIKGYYDAVNIAKKTFDPVVCECFAEYETLESVYKSHMPNLAKAINARSVIYRNGADSDFGFRPTNKSYNLNNNIKKLLLRSGHDINAFSRCYGNQLQQVIHQESLDILNSVGNLSSSSILYDHQEAFVDMTSSIVDYNHTNMPDKAMQIADFCWALLDYGQAIAEGAALGLYSAAHDILTNPIEATVSIVAGKQVLVFQLCKVLYNVAEIGVTAIHDSKKAQEEWNKYTEPLNNVIDAINKKEITVRDAIKNGSAFIVGYKAQAKLLGGLGRFCNTIKHKSISFVKNNLLLHPQEYLTTPEGLLFKATGQSGRIDRSTASDFKKNIENKIAQHTSIKGLLKKARLPTKGKLRYVPPKKLHVAEGLPQVVWHDRRRGFIDRFGNVWLKGESRTQGHDFEWDVQLSKQGIQQVGWMTRDNSHLNVSLDGRVTHK